MERQYCKGDQGMMAHLTISNIASGLNKVRWHGDYKFLACCPAHDDRNPSLSVSDKSGKILVKCWAGCTQEEVIDALRDLGLWHSASRHQLDRRKRTDLKREVRRHQDILASGIGTIKYGVALSELQEAELKKSIEFLTDHAHG